ncbi:MAG: enoyl-CoA hydratase/isomerase family protein [Candidatus Binatia bacterium]
MNGTIHVSRIGEHVALFEIDNPPRNTLGSAMRAKLREILNALANDPSVRALVVTGRGKAFCSGDDLREEFEAAAGGGERGANLLDFGRLLDQLDSFRAPVIAAVNGWCVGGGLELALCCDVRLASVEAQFVCAGVNVGLMASVYRLPRLIGVARAKHMLLTGLSHDAETAERFGLVTGVHQTDELIPAAVAFAERIASRAPLSVEATKRVASRAPELTPEEALHVQATELRALVQSADHLAAVTAFLEKRAPVFTRS